MYSDITNYRSCCEKFKIFVAELFKPVILTHYMQTILLLYTIYSFIGFFYLRSYIKECAEVNIEPFGGKLWKQMLYFFGCGGFTTLILLISAIVMIFHSIYLVFKFFKDDEHKK